MALFAWTQDVPITEPAYREIARRIGSAPMPGLVAHIAMQRPDGSVHYLDVWESEEACDKAFEAVIHPVVHPLLGEFDVQVAGEPPRDPVTVLEVRFADGTSVTG